MPGVRIRSGSTRSAPEADSAIRRSTLATAQLVEDAPVRQPQQPWPKAALLRVECTGSPPDGQENFLHEFLGGRSLQTLQCQVKHQARVSAVERAERLVPAVCQLEHQLFVGTCRVGPRGGCRIVALDSHQLGYTLDVQPGLPIRVEARGVPSTSGR